MKPFYLCNEFHPPKKEDYGSEEFYQEAVKAHAERKQSSDEGVYEYWKNDVYAVQIFRGPACLCFSAKNAGNEKNPHSGWPEMIWLSIKRLDREAIFQWRDMQAIKNELIGPEHEAVQIFPAESRLVDTSNQFHLWCMAEEGLAWPFGYLEREVMDKADAKMRGAKQTDQESCCANENRNMNGWCMNCGDPCY